MRHLMSPMDFSVEELEKLMDLAGDIEKNPEKYAHACAGKKLATLFYEPSTRTRLSHEAAMLNLGGSIMGFSSADSSSAPFPAMQTSAPCAIRKKALPWLPAVILPSRS